MAVADQKTIRWEQARGVAIDVIDECRIQLMLKFRFLDRALWRMPLEAVHVQARYPLATDGSQIYFGPEDVVARAQVSLDESVRDYLHLILHCVFRHPFMQARPRKDAWSLACDVVAEASALELAGDRFKSVDDDERMQALSELRMAVGVLSPAKLYSLFETVQIMPESNDCKGITQQRMADYRALFERDNHEAWPTMAKRNTSEEAGDVEELPQPSQSDDGDDDATALQAQGTGEGDQQDQEAQQNEAPESQDGQDQQADDATDSEDAAAGAADDEKEPSANDTDEAAQQAEDEWKDVARQMEVDLQTFSAEWGDEAGGLLQALSVANRRHADYSTFLRRFMTRAEELKINPDEFDYVFYTYGLHLYGNMPLIEPLEYAETQRIRDFVIAVDTSESCSGEVLKRFLERTFDILKEGEDFASQVNVHIVQCDAKVQADTKIESLKQIDALMEGFYVRGGGGTDFRPAFGYIDRLRAEGELADLQGLIYFTDGLGTFPDKAPEYDAAFVFLDDGTQTLPKVPPWAMKVVVGEENIKG